MITVESATALGTTDGEEFALRFQSALKMRRGEIVAARGFDAVVFESSKPGTLFADLSANWIDQADRETAARCTALLNSGSPHDLVISYAEARSKAFSASMDQYRADLETDDALAHPTKPINRALRRRLQALSRNSRGK